MYPRYCFQSVPVYVFSPECILTAFPVDSQFSSAVNYVLDVALQILMKIGAVVIISPIFAAPAMVVLVIGGWVGNIYMRAQLPVKRESSNAKAPVLGHFGSAIGGLGMRITIVYPLHHLSFCQ